MGVEEKSRRVSSLQMRVERMEWKIERKKADCAAALIVTLASSKKSIIIERVFLRGVRKPEIPT